MKPMKQAINVESPFEIEELFFSETDLKGIILSGNQVFTRISQFSEAELIGKPHNLIRHPDMPKSVFKLLWATIQKGELIGAYVKNMAKDGSYYWVFAVVIPLGNSYLSIRFKPTSKVFESIPHLYAEMTKAESKGDLVAGQKVLGKALEGLSLKDYLAFMTMAVRTEWDSRVQKLRQRGIKGGNFESMDARLKQKFAATQSLRTLLESFYDAACLILDLKAELDRERKSVGEFSDRVRFLSLNASTSSHRLGSQGRTLAIVAQQMQTTSEESIRIIKLFEDSFTKTVGLIEAACFEVTAGLLVTEMITSFLVESVNTQSHGTNHEIDSKLAVLEQSLDRMRRRIAQNSENLRSNQRDLQTAIEGLREVVSNSGFVQIAGKIETSSLADQKDFDVIFNELKLMVGEVTRTQLRLVTGIVKITHEIDFLCSGQSQFSNLTALMNP